MLLAFWALAPIPIWGAEPAGPPIPFPNSLDAAAVVQERLDDVLDNSLILGNGDINALLFATRAGLTLNLTKNDVWDARVDSSAERPLLKVDIAAHQWEGGPQGSPNGYSHPYPCPRICARLVLGDAQRPIWKAIRGEGRLNEWTNRDGAAVMAVEGQEGASNGFAYGPLDVSTDRYPTLRLRLSGTGNARFYVDLTTPDQSYFFSSRWIDSPRTTEERTFALPPGKQVGQVILYTWTVDGKRAENRFQKVTLEGPGVQRAVDLQQLSPPRTASVLDLRRAVAKVGERGETSVRALAQRNVFLIQSPLPARLEPATDTYVPTVERGETEGVEWLRHQLPGDLDWPGMSFVVTRAAAGDRQAVAIVTSRESPDPLADAIQLARATLAEPVACMKAELLKRSRPNGTITLQADDRCGHFTEQFAAAGAIAELLLQSVGDVIRAFPAWPREQDAKFESLRAQGGFLVSAEQQNGKVTKLQIVSTVGGKLRLLDPWTGQIVERDTNAGEKVILP